MKFNQITQLAVVCVLILSVSASIAEERDFCVNASGGRCMASDTGCKMAKAQIGCKADVDAPAPSSAPAVRQQL